MNIVDQIISIMNGCEKEYNNILKNVQNPFLAKQNDLYTLQVFANKVKLYRDLINHCASSLDDNFTKSMIMQHYYNACENMARHPEDIYKMTYEAYKFLVDRFCTLFKY